MNKTWCIATHVDRKTYLDIKALAGFKGCNVAELIRRALTKFIEEEKAANGIENKKADS